MTVPERLKSVIEYSKLSTNKFSNEIGYGRSENIYKLLRGEVKEISTSLAHKVVSKYPEISLEWLLTDKGNMFTYLNNKIKESQLPYYLNHDKQIEEKSSRSKEVGEEKIAGTNRIPFYDISISGGTLNFFNDYQELPSTTIEVPFMSDCDLALPVYGDSMHPVIKNGDIVLLKKVNNKSVIMYGEIYLVVTEDYRTLKYIRRNQDKELISLVSANENFDTVTIKKTAILQLYIYKGKFEKSQI